MQKMSLNNFSNKLKLSQQADIITEINQEEVEIAISSTNTGKTPGPDGLSTVFYKESWHIIGSNLIKLYQNIFKNGKIPPDMKKQYISLIYKKDSKT